jgi:hypothetical protein
MFSLFFFVCKGLLENNPSHVQTDTVGMTECLSTAKLAEDWCLVLPALISDSKREGQRRQDCGTSRH